MADEFRGPGTPDSSHAKSVNSSHARKRNTLRPQGFGLVSLPRNYAHKQQEMAGNAGQTPTSRLKARSSNPNPGLSWSLGQSVFSCTLSWLSYGPSNPVPNPDPGAKNDFRQEKRRSKPRFKPKQARTKLNKRRSTDLRLPNLLNYGLHLVAYP